MKRLLFLFWIFGTARLLAQTAETGNVWIVATGIGAYQHDDIMTRLDFTIQGAYEFTRIFEGRQLVGFKPPVLTNQKARRTDIIRAMEHTFVNNPEVREHDMILFYFSGHGEMAGDKIGIFPWDYSGDVRDLISDQDIQEAMLLSRARHKVCFIEACKTEAQSAAVVDPTLLESLNRQRRTIPGSLIYMTSTKAGEKSWGKPETGGYFTHYLVRGLKGEANANEDAFISIEELFSFVKSGVLELSKGKQEPQVNALRNNELSIPIMVVPGRISVQQPPLDISSEFIYFNEVLPFFGSNENIDSPYNPEAGSHTIAWVKGWEIQYYRHAGMMGSDQIVFIDHNSENGEESIYLHSDADHIEGGDCVEVPGQFIQFRIFDGQPYAVIAKVRSKNYDQGYSESIDLIVKSLHGNFERKIKFEDESSIRLAERIADDYFRNVVMIKK